MKWLRRKITRYALIILLVPFFLTLLYRFIPPPSTLMLYDIVHFRLPEREWVSLEQISPHLIKAVATAEDSAFCDHYGFDFRQMGKSVEKAWDNDTPLKATSTITQQTAKNLFLWHGRSWLRKLFEAPLTLWIELVLPKRRIFEIYLNIAQWDEGIYGAEAASQHHFGTSAKNLNAYQSALLAASLPNPVARNASAPSAYHARYAINIQKRMSNATPNLSCLK